MLLNGMMWILGQAQQPADAPAEATEAAAGAEAADPAAGTRIFDMARDHVGETVARTEWTGWLFLLGFIFIGLLAGKLAQNILRRIGQRMLDAGWTFRGTIFIDVAGPVNLALTTLGLGVGITAIWMSEPMHGFSLQVIKFLYIVSFGWFLYNLVDLVDVSLRRYASRRQGSLQEQVIPLIRKTLRIFVVIVFALFAAENVFDANIGAWLAGLGIAGLALSLAAQDSLKNLFGSITIFLDRPYVIGDRVTIAEHDGVVEDIGFRSTKLRTLAGHLVTIPNSRIVDSSVENIARRPNIRRLLNVTITYDTAPDKIQEAVQIIRDILAEPDIAGAFHDMEKFPPRVFFNDLNAASLNIIVLYWFYPVDWWSFMEHGQRFNLKLMRAYEEAGIDFAFPTQTIHLAGDPKRELAVRTLDRQGA